MKNTIGVLEIMNLLFMGPPGAGKGTQATFIAKKYNIPQISTGNILRVAVKNKTAMGIKAQGFMNAGKLVPDEVVVGIVRDRLQESDAQNGYILDGFPRTVAQADALKNILLEMQQGLDIAFSLEVPFEELTARLLSRAKEQGRTDDTADVIRNRLETYEKQTFPLLDYYQVEGILHKLDGIGIVEDITKRMLKILESIG